MKMTETKSKLVAANAIVFMIGVKAE